jgi:ABC-type amino acid transport substrate-binding protein
MVFRKAVIAKAVIGLALGMAVSASAWADMAKIRATGSLKVGVYNDNFPFSDKGEGIDVDLARAISDKLGLKLSLLPFPAGENLNDDLRNMVWKGHYLGYGPADVLMHVPVDRQLMASNDKVEIFAPYYRDNLRIAYRRSAVGQWKGLDSLLNKKVGVEKISLAAWVFMGEESGKYRDSAKIFEQVPALVGALKSGGIDAMIGNKSQVEAAVLGNPDFEVVESPFTRAPRQGWVVGMSVKRDNVELARAVQQAVNELAAEGQIKKIFEKHNVAPVSP